jgi:hypothetical protein
MVTDIIQEVAEQLPDHQTSRGAEFRAIPVEDRYPLARKLIAARSQVKASNADWDDPAYRSAIRSKKDGYMYRCGELHIDIEEAIHIWWSFVYGDISPADKRERDLI